ncbi:hypothetical protein PtrM4_092710 [Pyrenophora tritici-repentis]|uniref:Uncharacterized protein n=1 Tax=Pyrenophora tritici-repentis TaxID=45151 RepID=A0A834RXQ6_9PLEO|nr:hypothetical protein PtrM4_092710 [Pyrenophora tritici-repentis]
MLKRELAESSNHVLNRRVLATAVLAAESVEPLNAVKHVVDNGDDDGDTNGVSPDDDNGNNVDPAVLAELGVVGRGVGLVISARHPSEQGEDGGKSVDTENGNDELERGESLATTGNEDEPVLSEGDLEEENRLDSTKVLDDTTVGDEERTADDPSAESKKETKDDGDEPNLGQLPFDRTLLRVGVVVGNGDGSQISEEGEEDNELSADSLVEDDHRGDEVDFQVEAERDTVLDVGLHTLENLAGGLNGQDNGGETRGKEDDISGSLGSLGGTFDSDTAVRLLQGGGVVDTVTSHGSQVTTLLEHLDDLVLVLGEDFSETVGALDKVVLGSTGKTAVDELGRVVNLGTESKHLARLLGDGNSVTSQHLDGNTELLSLNNGLGSILTRGVEHGHETEKDPVTVVLLVSDTERSETTASELSGLLLVEGSGDLIAVGEVDDSLGGTLCADVLVTSHVADGSNTLGDGVEGSELLGAPSHVEDLAGLGVSADGENGNLVDGVERLEVVRRGKRSDGHHPVDILALGDVGLTKRQLVGSKRTGLVRAENVDTGKRLNGGELLDNSLLLSEVGSTDSEGGGGDNGKTDGDTDDEHDQGVVEEGNGLVSSSAVSGNGNVTEETTNPGEEDEEHDKDEKRRSDGVHDSLEVTLVLSALNKGGSATDERVLSGGDDDTVGLAALATSGVVCDFSHVLVDGERLSGDGRLIAGNERVALSNGVLLVKLVLIDFVILLILGVSVVELILSLELHVELEVLRVVIAADKTGITGDGLTLLNDDDITGNKLAGEDSLLLVVTNDDSLHGNVTLERGDDIGSLLLLVPTDNGVKQQDTADDTEINPILETGGEKSSELHDYLVLGLR